MGTGVENLTLNIVNRFRDIIRIFMSHETYMFIERELILFCVVTNESCLVGTQMYKQKCPSCIHKIKN